MKRILIAWLLAAAWLPAGCAWDQPVRATLPATVSRPERAVLVMFFDGLDGSVMRRMLAEGKLPNMQKHLFDRGVQVDWAVSDIPAITFAVNVTLMTGQFAGHHGITGNRWFDRNTLTLEDYVGIVDYRRVIDEFASPTILEMLADLYSAAILTPVYRGATRDFSNWLSTGVTWFFCPMAKVDSLTAHRMTQVAREAGVVGRWPDVLFAYFCGTDHVGHEFGSDSPQYEAILRNDDAQVGRIVDALQQAGMYDRTLLVLFTDHGHLPVRRHVDLRAILRDRFGFKVAYDSMVGGTYPKRYAVFGPDRVAMTDDGNRRAVIHLRVGEDWRTRPTLGQIERFGRDYGSPAHPSGPEPFWTLLLKEIGPGARLAAVRDGPNRVLVSDGAGTGVVERQVGPAAAGGAAEASPVARTATERYRYRVVEGPDPLQLSATPSAGRLVDGQFHFSQEWLAATCDAAYPDFAGQIVDYFDSPRSGDVLLFIAEGWDFSAKNRGGHGGASRRDMHIPLVFAGGKLPAGGHIQTARAADVAPTLLDYLGRLDVLRQVGPIDGVSRLESLRRAAPAAPASLAAPATATQPAGQ